MYLCLVAGGAVIAVAWRSPDFGLFGQLFVWSGSASLGGIVADAAVSQRERHRERSGR